MVGRGKSKKARSKGLSQGRKQDRISQLPDPLICHILSCLPTKEAVKTSVLSTRWRSLWLWVPGLDLASLEFPDFSAFKSFGDKFFDSNRVSCLHKLILDFDGDKDDASYLMSWIDDAVRRKIQHLHVRCSTNDYFCEIPISILTCETLVFLRLEWVALPDAEFFYLPCLKTMHLRYVLYANDVGTFERLVSSCPVLEELEIDECSNDDAIVFRVLSRSLKKLTIDLLSPLDGLAAGVVIDAPKLRFLNIRDNVSESFVITSIGSNANLCIDLTFGLEDFDEASVLLRRSSIRGFLSGISKVRDMTIRPDTFQILFTYSKLEPLPQFGCMSHLQILVCVSDLKWLPTFLESFPNLKSLILGCDGDFEEMNESSLSSVPECLPLSLEFVYFEIPISGHDGETKLVRYFLENSAILKKLALHLAEDSTGEKSTLKKLLRIPRGSTKCEVLVL